MDVNMMNNYAVRIIYDDPHTEEYRQKYQDALDEIQRLNRVIDDLTEKLRLSEIANGFLSERIDNLIEEVNDLKNPKHHSCMVRA